MKSLLPSLMLVAAIGALPAPAQPKRIVSTLPSATETLFALGVGDRVVAVSTYCRYPPAVLSLPKVGSYIKPDAEKIARLQPDLVILQKEASTLPDRLTALGIRYETVRFESLADIYEMMRQIGATVGAPARAASLNQSIHDRLAAIRSANQGHAKPSALMIVGRTPGLLTNLIAVASSTYLSELLDIAGGTNALKTSTIPYIHISLETVVRLDPDVILDLSMMGEAGEPGVAEQRLRQPWMSHVELQAVRKGNVFGLTSETLVTPGPRVVDAVEEIRSRLMKSRGAK